jgi:hypothetical protein
MDRIIAETHRIAAGSQFTGAAPGGGSDLRSGNLIYSEAAAGGLFSLPIGRTTTRPREIVAGDDAVRMVERITIVFGGQTSWTLNIVDVADNETLLLSGTDETDLVVTDEIELAPGESLKLETTGASAAMRAAVQYRVNRKLT